MDKVVSISFGELFLKGKNRQRFVDRAIKKVRKKISHIPYENIYLDSGKLYIEAKEEYLDEIIESASNVFGIIYLSKCVRTCKDFETIKKAAVLLLEDLYYEGKTFKVFTNRVDKSFTLTSPEISRELGAYILKNFKNLSVDIRKPELEIHLDLKNYAYLYANRVKGLGGLPIGSSGRGLVLLSGGIDSPVAGFLIAKRGVELGCIHFHSYPFTSERAFDKVKKLAEILATYTGNFTLYSVNLLKIQTEINKKALERETTVLSRRFMMRIADKLAEKNEYSMIVTGESLGQVASQTIEGINASNVLATRPVLRPLIGLDKSDIIEISEKIGTYETSIMPFEDCCTVFLPKRPVTKPRISDLERSEANMDIDALVDEALENMEIIRIKDKEI